MNRKIQLCLLALLAIISVGWAVTTATALTLTVDGSKDTDTTNQTYKTLQEAIVAANAATETDVTINIVAGSYTGEAQPSGFTEGSGTTFGELTKDNTTIQKAGEGEVVLNGALRIKGENATVTGMKFVNKGGNMDQSKNSLYVTAKKVTITGNVFTQDATIAQKEFVCNGIKLEPGSGPVDYVISGNTFKGLKHLSQPVSESYEYWCSTAIIWKESTEAEKVFGSYEADQKIAFESGNTFEDCTENYSRCCFPESEEKFYFQVTAASYLGSDEMGRRTFVGNAPVYLFGEGTFNEDVTISQPVSLIALQDSKLKFEDSKSLVIDANDVTLNNLDVTSTSIAVKINEEKTGTRINGGTYTCSVPDAEGVGPINFLGKNGDIYVSGATLTGKLGITNVTGKLNGITGNTIKYTSTSSAPVVGISALFESTLPDGVISPVELAAQNTITMPAAGAQYPVLYESSAWKGLDGLAYADTKDNLAALVGNSYGVKANVLIKLKANTKYSFTEDLKVQQEGLTLEGADGATLEFSEGGLVVDVNNVAVNNLNVVSNTYSKPLSINDGKTGVKVEGGSYSFTKFEAQGSGAVSFLGNNGDIYIKNVTTQGGIFALNCGKIDNIVGNTIQYSAKPEGDTHSYAGINLVFASQPDAIMTPEELLAKQKSVTMPDRGDQYQVLYQTSGDGWPVFDGLATASTSDALVALAANKDKGKNNIRINLASDIILTAPVLFTQTGMTLDGKGKTVSVADDFADNYSVVLGNGNANLAEAFTVKNLTLDNGAKAKGLNVYKMTKVTLENVTLKNSAGAGLVVNSSDVTASGLVTENNVSGGVNVGRAASDETNNSSFTLLGSDNNLQEAAPIYVDKDDVALIDAAEGQTITITSPGYIKPTTILEETAAVWTKYTTPTEGIASEDALQEAVANNQKEIVLPPTADPEGGDASIELTEPLTINAEITIKSEDPDVPAVITVPEGTTAFTTGEGGKLTLDNVVIKTTSNADGNTAPVIKVVEGTEATLQNSTLEVPANITAIEATGNMTISDVKLTVDAKTEGDAPVINVAKGGDVTIDNAAITNGTIEVTGTLTIEPAEKKKVVFTQTSEDKPALDLKNGANVTITNAQFTGKAVEAASGATINFSNCNFSSPADTKAMRMTRSIGGEGDATVIEAGDATATIEGCIFTGIKGENPMLSGKNLTVKSCLFYDNEDMVMINIAASGTSVIANNTCVNNNEEAVSAIINNASETAVIKNNIFWTNAAEAITGTATGTTISHNALKTAAVSLSNNNLKLSDFNYIKFNSTNHPYQLHADSPVAKAQGDITAVAEGAMDILGEDRLTSDGTNNTVHLGAYESVYTPTTGGGSTGGSTGDTTPDATGIKLDKTTLTLARLQSYTLVATVEPAAAGGVKWTSTDPSVATVDANGKVTAVKVGQATIIATAINGGLTALCQVTVDFATGVEEALAESAIFGREGAIEIRPATPVQVMIVNMAGTVVANRTISQTETISAAKGIYIVRLSSGGNVLTQKVNVR